MPARRFHALAAILPRLGENPELNLPLTPGVPAGTVLYEYPGPTVGDGEIAVTQVPGEPPWFPVAEDSAEEI